MTTQALALIAGLDGPTLRLLARIADDRDHPKAVDPAAMADELGRILEAGGSPTVGFFRHHRAARPIPPRRPAPPETYERVRDAMVADGWAQDLATDAVATIAREDGVAPDVVEAIRWGRP